MMNIAVIDKDKRGQMLIGELLKIWEASVRASHHFLTDTDIVRLIYKIPQKGVIDWLLRENYRGAAVF